MKRYKAFVNESTQDEIAFLQDLSVDLTDEGLYVTVTENDPKFHFKGCLYLIIEDKDNVFCKNYPKDDMDWLYGKPIIDEFLKKIEAYGMHRVDSMMDSGYLVYGGGKSTTLVFTTKGRKSIKLK